MYFFSDRLKKTIKYKLNFIKYHVWSLLTKEFIRLNFYECSLDSLGQLEIGRVIGDHYSTKIKTFCKPTSEGFAIKVEILALLAS